jgi:hypothetical protein
MPRLALKDRETVAYPGAPWQYVIIRKEFEVPEKKAGICGAIQVFYQFCGGEQWLGICDLQPGHKDEHHALGPNEQGALW